MRMVCSCIDLVIHFIRVFGGFSNLKDIALKIVIRDIFYEYFKSTPYDKNYKFLYFILYLDKINI